jgi:hypothetical protein
MMQDHVCDLLSREADEGEDGKGDLPALAAQLAGR